MEPKLETRDSEAIACAQYYERERGVEKKERREKKEEKVKQARAVAQLMGVLSGMRGLHP